VAVIEIKKTKNPWKRHITVCQGFFINQGMKKESIFFNRDGVFFTYFNTALAAHALFCIHRNGFSVFHLKYFHGAYVYTFFTTYAFTFVYDRGKSHLKKTSCWIINI